MRGEDAISPLSADSPVKEDRVPFEYTCRTCGEPFVRIGRPGPGRRCLFCSRACSNRSPRGVLQDPVPLSPSTAPRSATSRNNRLGPEPLPPGILIAEATIFGQPLPKERPRTNTATGRTYTPQKTKDAEEMFGWGVKAGMLTERNDTHDLRVEAVFHRRKGTRADVDNLLKMAMDGCNGVVWKDDSQVVEINARLVRQSDDPHTEIRVYIAGDRSVGTCARCGVPISVPPGGDGDHRLRRNPERMYCSGECYYQRNVPIS